MNFKILSLIFGFSVWLIATLVFRYWGHTFFIVESFLPLVGFFLITVPFLYLLMQLVFNSYSLSGTQKLESAVFMSIPGMIFDVACLKFHYLVFPKLSIEQAVNLGAWILWAYLIVLLIGVIKSSNKYGRTANVFKEIS